MASDANGWPATPGVPENPERDGWHWVVDGNHETVVAEWNADVQRWGSWPFCSPADFAEDNEYVSPCLLPSEVAAREAAARRAGIEAAAKVCRQRSAMHGTDDGFPNAISDEAADCAAAIRAADLPEPPR